MVLRYYDPIDNRMRIKRRYVWSFWSFCAGTAAGGVVIYSVLMMS